MSGVSPLWTDLDIRSQHQPRTSGVRKGKQRIRRRKAAEDTGCSVSIGTIVLAIILNVSKFTTDFASLWLVQTRSKTDFTIGHV